MNIEQAINYLKSTGMSDEQIIVVVDAFTCEDCISRQATVDAADKIIKRDTSGNNAVVNAMIAWSEYIKTLPSVTPKLKTGHWILTDVELSRVWHCNCSECGKDPLNYVGGSENWWLIKNNFPKFCPSCGAKMAESEDK